MEKTPGKGEKKKEYHQGKWDLTKLLDSPSGHTVDDFMKDIEADVAKFEGLKDKLSPEMRPKELYDAFHKSWDIGWRLRKMQAYAHLLYAGDTSNPEAPALVARTSEFSRKTRERKDFLNVWWKSLDGKDAKKYIESATEDMKEDLQDSRKKDKHELSRAKERIIGMKDNTGQQGLLRVYSTLTNGFDHYMTVDGKRVNLTEGELAKFIEGKDAGMRRKACKAMLSPYKKNINVLGEIYQDLVRDWKNENLELRKYDTPIQPRNKWNDMPDSAVETLLKSCEDNKDVFQNYFKLKAERMGVSKLSRYDLYAPTVKDAAREKKYSFEEAADTVLETFKEFSPKAEKLARKLFDEKHIDSEVRKGKQGGAFCSGVTPSTTPYVLLSYDGTFDGVSTLAHELGHAVHFQLAGEAGNVPGSLPLDETASTFSETILSEKMMSRMEPKEKERMLAKKIEDEYGTIMRQAYFVKFEKDAHEAIAKGATTTDLCKLYNDNLKDLYGNAVDVPKDFQFEWSRIPHIHNTPFYCYAYAFGELLSLSLYEKYKEEGKKFVPKYLDFLANGGSKESPDKALKKLGVDMNSKEFWDGGFKYIRSQVAELRKLAK